MAQASRAVGGGGETPLSVRLETYNASDRIERAEPSPPMASRFDQITYRGVRSRSSPAEEGSSSATSARATAGDVLRGQDIQGTYSACCRLFVKDLVLKRSVGLGTESSGSPAFPVLNDGSLPAANRREPGGQEEEFGRDYGFNRVEYEEGNRSAMPLLLC